MTGSPVPNDSPEVADPHDLSVATSIIRRRIFTGFSSNATAKAFNYGALFLLTPFILGHIGPTGYGLWVLVGSLFAYGSLLDLGLGAAVVKYVAQFNAAGDYPRLKTFLATALCMYLALGGVALLITLVLTVAVTELAVLEAGAQDTARLLVLLMGTNFAVAIAVAPATSVLHGLQRFELYNLIKSTGVVLWAVGVVVVLSLGWGVVGMVAISIPITIFVRMLSVAAIRRASPHVELSYRGASVAEARSALRFSGAILVSTLGELFQKKSDEIIIGVSLAVAAVTPYALARRLSELAHLLTDQFVRVLLPVASELDQSGDRRRMQDLLVHSSRVAMAIFLPVGLSVALLGRELLLVWLGPGYEEAVPVIEVLVVASLILISAYPAGSLLQGMGRFWPVAISSLISGVFNVVISVALVAPLGLVGVAIGTLIPTAAEVLLFVYPYSMVVIGVALRRVLAEVWLAALAPAVPAAIVLVLLRDAIGPTSLPALALVGGLGTATYLIAYLATPWARVERAVVGAAVKRLLSGRSRSSRSRTSIERLLGGPR